MGNHICPWWAGYLLANPLRRIIENPEKMIAPFVRPGMYVIDYGCGMGFFTLPLAKMVGPTGKVIAVDVQGKMLNTLRKKPIDLVCPTGLRFLPQALKKISKNVL